MSIKHTVEMFYKEGGKRRFHSILLQGMYPGENLEMVAQGIVFKHPFMNMSYELHEHGRNEADNAAESDTMTNEGKNVTPNQ